MKDEIRYFAAANGYRGFKSYFNEVFPTTAFERIFVLKGGPGTGKSSFMKAIQKELLIAGCECESIYCSSDPHSLDGIICKNNEKKIAVIDGTAPHQRDAEIPGASDEIINLGDSWDSDWLIAERKKIEDINTEKKKAYKTAYSYLNVSGAAAREVDRLIPVIRNSKKINLRIKSEAEFKSPEISTRLISSFGKFGSYRFDTLEKNSKTLYSLQGDERSCYVLMDEMLDELKKTVSKIIRFPSPLNEDNTEAIYLPCEQIAFVVGGNGECISADEYFHAPIPTDKERVKTLSDIHYNALIEAKRWFNIASDLHFRLEDIYSHAMNFENNDRILYEKLLYIREILDL